MLFLLLLLLCSTSFKLRSSLEKVFEKRISFYKVFKEFLFFYFIVVDMLYEKRTKIYCLRSISIGRMFFIRLMNMLRRQYIIYIYIYIYIYIHFFSNFFIIQRVKARTILCPHQPPTRVIT